MSQIEEQISNGIKQLFNGDQDPLLMNRLTLRENFNKSAVNKNFKGLIDFVEMLKSMKSDLDIIKNGNLVLVVGNTGCGKSTMLSSLIYGPDALQKTAIKAENGKKRYVIDHKDSDKSQLRIGHDQSKSQTFWPNFIQDQNSKIIFGDIAGLEDTSGQTIELLNVLTNKLIFNQAVHLRFLVPLTLPQILESRGTGVRKQL